MIRTGSRQDDLHIWRRFDKGDALGTASISSGSPLLCRFHTCVRCSRGHKLYLGRNLFDRMRCYHGGTAALGAQPGREEALRMLAMVEYVYYKISIRRDKGEIQRHSTLRRGCHEERDGGPERGGERRIEIFRTRCNSDWVLSA